MASQVSIPVIDLFAGPGGLGEGFSAYPCAQEEHPFRQVLSIEMDPAAHKTLHLRTFLRQFPKGPPAEYYAALAGNDDTVEKRLEALFAYYPDQAAKAAADAWLAELGKEDRSTVRQRIAP